MDMCTFDMSIKEPFLRETEKFYTKSFPETISRIEIQQFLYDNSVFGPREHSLKDLSGLEMLI